MSPHDDAPPRASDDRRVTPADVRAARDRIAPVVSPSPLVRSIPLSDRLGVAVWLKLESLQPPGSFKLRGAASRLLALSDEERERGVVTCSSGNHGLAVAHVAARLGIRATICVPEWVDPVKLAAIERTGARAVVAGATFDASTDEARRIERDERLVFVHPFDDPFVVAGQGTIGLEVAEEVPAISMLAVAVSGGGLVGGIAVALKSLRPRARVVATSARRARTMAESVRAGAPLDVPEEPTLATALAGGIGLDNRWTFPIVRDLVDDIVLVDEESIARGMAFAFREHHLAVEGGGAVALGAALDGLLPTPAGDLVVVVSGGNVDAATIADVTARGLGD